MRNVLKLIKYLSLALCFGLYLNLTTAPVGAADTFWSDSKGKKVSWSELTEDEQKMYAQFAVLDNAIGRDKLNAAEKNLQEAKNSGDAAQIKAAQDAYDKAQAEYKKALETYNAQRTRESNRRGALNDALTAAEDSYGTAQEKTQGKQDDLKKASQELSAAVKSQDQDAIKKARAKYDQALQDLQKAEEDEKDAKKAKEKASKDNQKNVNNIKKETEKEEKNIKKEQDKAEKNLKNAEKDIKELEDKCNSSKGCSQKDQEKLAKAYAKQQEAQNALDEANAKAHAMDVAKNQRAMEEAYKESQVAEETAQSADDIAEQAAKDIAEATSNAPQMCNVDEIKGNIFLLIACKATTTLADLRVIAYIISGFGMVALAYAAIFGKMNWKHLANIGIGLFLLSMMTPFIEYFVYDGKKELQFGKYLPAGFTDIQGSDGEVEDCGKYNDGKGTVSLCDVLVEQEVKKEKWGWKDLKGSIQAGMDAVRSANNMVQATKNTVSNVKNQVSNMANAIKNGGGGLDGIINGVTAVAGAAGNIVNSGQLLANNIASNASNLTNNIRDAGSTNQDREARAKHQEQMDLLSRKCNAGNCSDTEKEALKKLQETVQNEKTGFDKWMENDGAGGGATIMAGINQVGNIANDTRNVANAMANGVHEGQNIGGGGVLGTILGIGMGAGTGFVEGTDAFEKNKQNGNFDFRSEENKRDQAYKQSADYITHEVEQDGKTIQNRGDGSTKITYADGSTTITNKDGSSVITKADGTTTTRDAKGNSVTTYKDDPNKKVVENADGTKTVTDSQGNSVTYDATGKQVNVNLTQENKFKRQTAESNQAALSAGSQAAKSSSSGTSGEQPKSSGSSSDASAQSQAAGSSSDGASGAQTQAAGSNAGATSASATSDNKKENDTKEEAKKKDEAEKYLKEQAAAADCSKLNALICSSGSLQSMPMYKDKCKECGF